MKNKRTNRANTLKKSSLFNWWLNYNAHTCNLLFSDKKFRSLASGLDSIEKVRSAEDVVGWFAHQQY